MDFNFNPEDEAFRMEFRAWLDANKQFAPHMGETTIGMAEGRGEFDKQKDWAKKMAEGRWLAPSWPKKYGGRGAGILQNIVYGEELARAGVAAPMIGMGISLFGPTLLHWGTEEQKQRFIPPIIESGRNLVPGIFGARLGLRPRVVADPRGRGRRLLRRQRAESLDLDRAARRLDLSAGAHRSRRAQA